MAIAAAVLLLVLSGWANAHPWGWILLLGLGGGYWYWRRRSTATVAPAPQPLLQVQQVTAELAQTHTLLKELPVASQGPLQQTYDQLQQRLETPTVDLCVLGQSRYWLEQLYQGIASMHLPQCHLHCQTLATVPQADLILFSVTGALTASEFEMLQVLTAGQYRVLVVWLQVDTAAAEQVHLHLRQQLQQVGIDSGLLMAISPGDLPPLRTRLNQLLEQERHHLVLAGTYRRAQQLYQQAQAVLNRYRQERATPIIERYQWLAAGATAINPLPLLDLVVAGGLLVRLTWELGQIYQRSFQLGDAQPIAKELLRLLVQLGAVELGTQSMGQWLKGNSLTYLAGSCLQGATAAYVFRVSGWSLIHYFETLPQTQGVPLAVRLRQSIQWARQQVGQFSLQTLG